MRSHLVVTLAILLGVGLLACSQQSTAAERPSGIRIEGPSTIDLGVVGSGTTVSHTFKVVNHGPEKLAVHLSPSCTCAAAKLVPNPVPAGSEAELKVTLKPNLRFNTDAQVLLVDDENKQLLLGSVRLRAAAERSNALEISNTKLVLHSESRPSTRVALRDIYSVEPAEIGIDAPNWLDVKMTQVDSPIALEVGSTAYHRSYELEVGLADFPTGTQEEGIVRLSILRNGVASTEEIQVKALSPGLIWSNQESISLGIVRTTEKTTNADIYLREGLSAEDLTVAFDEQALQVSLETVSKGHARMDVSVTSVEGDASLVSSIQVLHPDLAVENSLTIRVSGLLRLP